jgi:hypothetical protein
MQCERRSGLTRTEVLVLIVILAAVAAFLWPLKQAGRKKAYTIQCASNLKQIYSVAFAYSEEKGNGFFPATLSELVAFDPEGLDPKLFFCPRSDGVPALRGEDGNYTLTPRTTSYASYAWITKPIENTPPEPAPRLRQVRRWLHGRGRPARGPPARPERPPYGQPHPLRPRGGLAPGHSTPPRPQPPLSGDLTAPIGTPSMARRRTR